MSRSVIHESFVFIGVVNDSVRTFTRSYEHRPRNTEIVITCIAIFAFSIVQDFLHALWRAIRG